MLLEKVFDHLLMFFYEIFLLDKLTPFIYQILLFFVLLFFLLIQRHSGSDERRYLSPVIY